MPPGLRIASALLLAGALVVPSLRWRRTAFGGFLAVSLASFGFRAGWPARQLSPTACEGLVSAALALHSFRNTPHIVLFALCFVIARAQFGWAPGDGTRGGRAPAGALAITLGVGALVELAEGLSGAGHCRLRDLLPDAAGALLGWATVALCYGAWARWRGGTREAGARPPT